LKAFDRNDFPPGVGRACDAIDAPPCHRFDAMGDLYSKLAEQIKRDVT
jgi:hypothetical protein